MGKTSKFADAKATADEIAEILRLVGPAVPPAEPVVEEPPALQMPPRRKIKVVRPKNTIEDAEKPRLAALPFATITEFYSFFFPDIDLSKWQIQEQLQISGHLDGTLDSPKFNYTSEAPMLKAIVAANGAGKDAMIIAAIVGWALLSHVQCRVVLTSASHKQLVTQTENYIRILCDTVNHKAKKKLLEYKALTVTSPLTGSECILYATDEPGKAEGYHPIVPDGKLFIILNEIKSISKGIVEANMRCSGYTHWLAISSPGLTDTYFYKFTQSAEQAWPQALVPGQPYKRHISAYECPWRKKAEIDFMISQLGINHPVVQSSVFAQFVAVNDIYIVPEISIHYPPPKTGLLGNVLRAGLDLALGGDETVLSVWRGNYRIGQEVWRIRHEPILHVALVAAFKKYGLVGPEINVDAGGGGEIIVSRLWEAGYHVNPLKNEFKSENPAIWRNLGTQNWWMIRRLVQEQLLILPMEDELLIHQLTRRQYQVNEKTMVINVEPKHEARSRGDKSPDRADALVLAFADISHSIVAEQIRQLRELAAPRRNKNTLDLNGDVEEQIALLRAGARRNQSRSNLYLLNYNDHRPSSARFTARTG